MNHWMEQNDLKLFAKILETFSHYGEGRYYLKKLCCYLSDEDVEDVFRRAKKYKINASASECSPEDTRLADCSDP